MGRSNQEGGSEWDVKRIKKIFSTRIKSYHLSRLQVYTQLPSS